MERNLREGISKKQLLRIIGLNENEENFPESFWRNEGKSWGKFAYYSFYQS
jgi:hypothetical protein